MKFSIFFISIILCGQVSAQSNTHQGYINPTGTYGLITNAKMKRADIYGTTGSIQVKALSENKVVIVLGVNMGAPAYNSGEALDTLVYKNNRCIYKVDEYDSSCRITFIFTTRGVKVTQKQSDLNYGCGFGHGVFADGFYKKESGKTPILRHPQSGELIK